MIKERENCLTIAFVVSISTFVCMFVRVCVMQLNAVMLLKAKSHRDKSKS